MHDNIKTTYQKSENTLYKQFYSSFGINKLSHYCKPSDFCNLTCHPLQPYHIKIISALDDSWLKYFDSKANKEDKSKNVLSVETTTEAFEAIFGWAAEQNKYDARNRVKRSAATDNEVISWIAMYAWWTLKASHFGE